MPYISQDNRNKLDKHIEDIQGILKILGNTEGDLNYTISRLIGAYFIVEPRYKTIARVRGVLQDVQDEFYRRVAVPYENYVIAKNGDISEFLKINKTL